MLEGAEQQEPPPFSSALAATAYDCWAFCGGWVPERWPIYAGLFGVQDFHSVVEVMRSMRAKV